MDMPWVTERSTVAYLLQVVVRLVWQLELGDAWQLLKALRTGTPSPPS